MANEGVGHQTSREAVADLSSAQYRYVVASSTKDFGVKLPSTANNQRPVGILQNDPISGGEATVQIDGISKLAFKGSTLSRGDFFTMTTGGLGTAPSTEFGVLGQIISGTSGTTGRILTVQMQPTGTTAVNP